MLARGGRGGGGGGGGAPGTPRACSQVSADRATACVSSSFCLLFLPTIMGNPPAIPSDTTPGFPFVCVLPPPPPPSGNIRS